ncbi:NAD-binding protein [Trichloromonas sp.]|uniref:potassium channel family protein n=1 Tax=Trichloromonas sp. TaxID=3069249 RepID=UPI003D81A047
MLTGRLIIIGLGNIGMTLVRTLSRDFRLVCVDVNEKTLQAVRKLWGESVETYQGDATSRLVLQKVGISPADTVAITTSSEEINLEVARVLHQHFPEVRTIGIGITQAGIQEMASLGIEVEGIFAASATGMRNRLEHRSKTVHGIGIGKNEILEVEVSPSSRLANKPLGWLRPKSWRFGLIYRDGNIVVPSKSVVLKPRDKVVILGEPRVLKTVAERLSSSLSDFPLDYGDTGLILVGDRETPAFFSEIAYLASTLPLRRLILAVAEGTEIPELLLQLIADKDPVTVEISRTAAPLEVVRSTLDQRSCSLGLCVMSPGLLFKRFSAARAKRQLLDIFAQADCPVLLATGSHPYEKIAVPCLDQHASHNALESAMDIAADMYSTIEALLALPSKYISTEKEGDDYSLLKKNVSDVALAYRSSIRRVELTGNPIHSFSQALDGYNLQVNEISTANGGSLLHRIFYPDVPWSIVRRARPSALLIPAIEEVL